MPAPEVARVVVVRDVPDIVFTGFVGSYGRVLRAPSALLMVGTETARSFQEGVGYLGEAAILEATSLGAGDVLDRRFLRQTVASTLVPLAPGERVLAISPLGYAAPRPRAGERMMKRVVGAHKRKAREEIAPGFDEESWPAWAAEGVRLARVAPSAVNRQPWRFELDKRTGAGRPFRRRRPLRPSGRRYLWWPRVPKATSRIASIAVSPCSTSKSGRD